MLLLQLFPFSQHFYFVLNDNLLVGFKEIIHVQDEGVADIVVHLLALECFQIDLEPIKLDGKDI